MIFCSVLKVLVLALCFTGMTTEEVDITGLMGDMVTLPCTYSAKSEAAEVCWRKTDCSMLTCSNSILRTNGSSVIKRTSERYHLLGNITWGDASLTITKLTTKDKGTYCCEVIMQKPSNNVRREVNVQIIETPVVFGSVNDTVTLPCTYSISEGIHSMYWGKGNYSNCSDGILRTRSSSVTKRKSKRYELLGNITQGNASLTINNLTIEDEGMYCCNVYIPGPDNDVYKKVILQISTSGERLSWMTPGNMIRGITIFLVPPIVLLIYKCCSL